jgi:hypothetical protein
MSCDEIETRIAPILERIHQGPSDALPEITIKEPGRRSIEALGSSFSAGFYWYRATPREEIVMMLAAKHLEQRALNELRKEQGITYSPHAHFVRSGRSGAIILNVVTDGRDRLVAKWFDRTVDELINADHPRALLKDAIRPVNDSLENDGVLNGLATIRGERGPEEVLRMLTDEDIHASYGRFLSPDRIFSSSTPTANVASLAILGLFGLAVIGVCGYVAAKLMRSGRR